MRHEKRGTENPSCIVGGIGAAFRPPLSGLYDGSRNAPNGAYLNIICIAVIAELLGFLELRISINELKNEMRSSKGSHLKWMLHLCVP